MAAHNELGKKGEEMALQWLRQKGFEIIHHNWRHSWFEIDIVARKEKFLHFVEVKTLKASSLGFPEDSVTKKKFRKLKRAADEYLFLHPGHGWISYDILAITIHSNNEADYFFIEDVFL